MWKAYDLPPVLIQKGEHAFLIWSFKTPTVMYLALECMQLFRKCSKTLFTLHIYLICFSNWIFRIKICLIIQSLSSISILQYTVVKKKKKNLLESPRIYCIMQCIRIQLEWQQKQFQTKREQNRCSHRATHCGVSLLNESALFVNKV